MKMHVKGNIRDLLAFKNLVPARKKRILKTPASPVAPDAMAALSARLHPARLQLVISEVRPETATSRTFRLEPDPQGPTRELPPFQAGQYLSVKLDIDGVHTTRPYAIASAPREAREDGFYELTIRKMPGGFVSGHIWDNWQEGTRVKTSGPEGHFFFEPLRDAPHIVALAGGSGITPFRAMMKDILAGESDARLTLLYGTRLPGDIIFAAELATLAAQAPDRLALHLVCSEPDQSWSGPTGFLSAATIRSLAGNLDDASVFICGPPAMYRFLEKELAAFDLPPRRIRREAFGEIRDLANQPGFPIEIATQTFTLTVTIGEQTHTIPARGDETVLVAMERAGLAPPSQCRSGECGFCRAELLGGQIHVLPDDDGRRAADIAHGGFHPCASYPMSDLTIAVPPDPGGQGQPG